MGTVRSKDGTTIAFDVWGDGQPLIVVDGATAYRGVNLTNAEVGQLLREEFRVYVYDRRGRGESTDTAPYAVQREIEDLAALIDHAGTPAVVFGWSSGAVLALDDAVAGGRPGDAVELFLTVAAGMPAEAVPGMRQSPFWPALEAVAHTIAYDGRIMGTTMSGAPLPRDRWAAVTVPILVMHGTGTEPWLIAAARALAELLPTASLQAVEGQQHSAAADVLAPRLRRFAQGR